MVHFLGVIPARYASTRFPGKPLALLGNKPMIQWVYEKAISVFPRLVVATDDSRIREAVESFGGKALMTSTHHRTGTERCAEALDLVQQQQSEPITHVVNIQGDEPLLKPEHLEVVADCFNDSGTLIATLIRPLSLHEELADPNVVKVVVDQSNRALYFSRSPIPYIRDASQEGPILNHPFFAHIGLYAFRAEVLRQLVRLPVSALEKAESLEQLRWLEHGYAIQTRVTDQPSRGVDTPEDLQHISKLI